MKKEFKIEKGIPVSEIMYRSKNSSRFANVLNEMEAGDSIFFEEHKDAILLYSFLKKNKIKSKTRKVEGGFRTWRLS